MGGSHIASKSPLPGRAFEFHDVGSSGPRICLKQSSSSPAEPPGILGLRDQVSAKVVIVVVVKTDENTFRGHLQIVLLFSAPRAMSGPWAVYKPMVAAHSRPATSNGGFGKFHAIGSHGCQGRREAKPDEVGCRESTERHGCGTSCVY